MQIMIDIPEYLYEQVLDLYNEPILGLAGDFTKDLIKGVANGIPLPKGHGDLVDRDDVYDFLCKADAMMVCDALSDGLEISELPTIIETDEGGTE